ncbi:MAG TPA: hypothetical protein VM324_02535 [Egibacteraceae bacterium]|jgi:hypothetical protein|nr:hypothetical protein [Egibacteraceae bacterium]
MSTINTMRGLLVAGAVFAALVAALFGQWSVVVILGVGIAAHAGLWVHLSRAASVENVATPKPPAPGTAG